MVGTWGAQGPRGAPRSRGRAVGQVHRRARRGRGSGLYAQLPLSRAQRGGGRPRGRCPGSAMLLRGREGGREEGGRAARSRAGRGAGAAGAGGGEDPARGAEGGGPGPRRAGLQGVGASSTPGRGEAGSDGHGRRSFAPLLLPRSLAHTRAEGGEARSSHFPTFQTSQRNFFLSSPDCASSSPIPPPSFRLLPARP